ncbi:MAG: hypothetical protein SFX73_01970 [Kofleriaceae bacterium]|nr:hypothetical protein [Kofleriaceae bacterium]
MRSALLITLALVGSVSVADAQSRWTNDSYNEAPYGDSRWSQPPGGRWFSVSGIMDTRRTRPIPVNNQSLNQIGVRATHGVILIRRITVEFANRNVVDYEVNARLRPGQVKTIDVRGRRVRRIQVMADPRWGGTYQILASPGYRRPGPPIG